MSVTPLRRVESSAHAQLIERRTNRDRRSRAPRVSPLGDEAIGAILGISATRVACPHFYYTVSGR